MLAEQSREVSTPHPMRQMRASRRRSDPNGSEALCTKGKCVVQGIANGYTTLPFHGTDAKIGNVKSGSLCEGSDQAFKAGSSIEAMPQHIEMCTQDSQV